MKQCAKKTDGALFSARKDFALRRFSARGIARGFGLIEAVVGVALISLFLASMTEAAKFSVRLTEDSDTRLAATFLLEEGMDAVKGMRDAGWTSGIIPLAPGTDYWLVFTGGAWTLSSTEQRFIDGRFDRRVRVDPVNRDSNDDIVSSGGTPDAGTKKVTVTVAWRGRSATTTDSFSAYITDIFGN